jgi:hypothetical protein
MAGLVVTRNQSLPVLNCVLGTRNLIVKSINQPACRRQSGRSITQSITQPVRPLADQPTCLLCLWQIIQSSNHQNILDANSLPALSFGREPCTLSGHQSTLKLAVGKNSWQWFTVVIRLVNLQKASVPETSHL